jgi:hypothetical protein
MWQRNVAGAVSESGKVVPELMLLPSPFRYVLDPLVEHIVKVELGHPERQIAVLVPELVVKYWWQLTSQPVIINEWRAYPGTEAITSPTTHNSKIENLEISKSLQTLLKSSTRGWEHEFHEFHESPDDE